MKRNKKPEKKVISLVTGDWHLREDVPLCRTDDYWSTQWGKVKFISELQEKYECPVIHSGDLFHHWKPSPYLLSTTIKNIPKKFFTIYGNHDIPQNSMEMKEKSGLETLSISGAITIIPGDYGISFDQIKPIEIEGIGEVILWHGMAYQGKMPFEGCEYLESKKLLRKLVDKFPEIKVVITGHNHQTFTEEYSAVFLINPGSIMRITSDQKEHEPVVFLLHEDYTISEVKIPLADKNPVSQRHIIQAQEKEKRIEAFIEKLNTNWESDVSFRVNLERFFNVNHTQQNIENLVWESLEENEK